MLGPLSLLLVLPLRPTKPEGPEVFVQLNVAKATLLHAVFILVFMIR